MEGLREAKPPVEVPWYEPWMLWSLLALVLLALLGMIWLTMWWVRKNRLKGGIPPTARARALEDFEALASEIDSLNGRDFGVRSSDVLRRYFAEAYRVPARRQTSFEFFEQLRNGKTKISPKTMEFLQQFMTQCDLMKYAPVGVASQPNQRLLEDAAVFVKTDLGGEEETPS